MNIFIAKDHGMTFACNGKVVTREFVIESYKNKFSDKFFVQEGRAEMPVVVYEEVNSPFLVLTYTHPALELDVMKVHWEKCMQNRNMEDIGPFMVLESAAGFYVGHLIKDPECDGNWVPYDNQSDYFGTEQEAFEYLAYLIGNEEYVPDVNEYCNLPEPPAEINVPFWKQDTYFIVSQEDCQKDFDHLVLKYGLSRLGERKMVLSSSEAMLVRKALRLASNPHDPQGLWDDLPF